jgi:hypothetical protein
MAGLLHRDGEVTLVNPRNGNGRRILTLVLGAALVVGAPLALSGCSVVEGIIEQQTGGEVDIGGPSVPTDFPGEVPLAEGTVVNGSSGTAPDGQQVWNVLMNVTDPAAPDSIAAQLEASGFVAAEVGGVTESGGTLTYTKDDLVVNVLLAKTDGGWTANYTVARTAATP